MNFNTTNFHKQQQLKLAHQYLDRYIIMDHLIDSRLNRSLANHDLDNLVFQKRQRKTIDQTPPLIMQKKQSKLPSSKTAKHKRPILQDKKKGKIVGHHKKNGYALKIKKQTSIKKNLQKRPKKLMEQSEGQVIIQEQIDDDYEQSQVIKSKSKQKHQRQQKANQKPFKGSKVRQSENNDANIRIKHKVPAPKQKTIKTFIKQQQDIEQLDSEQQIQNIQRQKRGRGRPRKNANTSQNIQNTEEKLQIKRQEQLISPLLPQKLSIPNTTINTIHIPVNNVKQAEQMLSALQEVNNPRSRKAKMNPLVKYNQNDEDHYSQQSFQTQKGLKKKKKISKSSRPKNKNNKPYSLNRIFRKQAKKHFPAFQVNVDLNKLSLQSFINEFGVFDLIHFSLPIRYLHFFPQIPLLIDKGFIFVWVQQKQTQIGYHLLNRWGFDVIDQILWIKAIQEEGKVQADNTEPWKMIDQQATKSSQLFINIKDTCLVGYKCPLGNKAEYRTKVSNNIIFAKRQSGIKKAEQIYEIADLMMPGAKKLQFGGSAQKGWLNLKHHESTLYRCNICLSQQNIFVLHQKAIHNVVCKKCIVDQIRYQNQDNCETQLLESKFKEFKKSKIGNILYFQPQNKICCLRCGRDYAELAYEGLIKVQDEAEYMCLHCYQIKMVSIQTNKSVSIVITKKRYYNQGQIQCSSCKSNTMYDIYFQCNKCKNHKICKGCFWKSGQKIQNLNCDDQIKKPVKIITHEWKLRFVKSHPLMKFSCFGCKKQLGIPFWSCETCQSWTWCGKCDRGSHEVHPHYQNDKHKEYLLI